MERNVERNGEREGGEKRAFAGEVPGGRSEGELFQTFFDSAQLDPEVGEFGAPEGFAAPVGIEFAETAVGGLGGAPGEIMHHSHGAERLDEFQGRFVEVHEETISVQECIEFGSGIPAGAGEEEPEVLDGRAVEHVVEVDCEQTFVETVEDIGAMEVAMDPDGGISGVAEEFIGDVEDPVADVHESGFAGGVDQPVPEDSLHGGTGETVRCEVHSVSGPPEGTAGMDLPEQCSDSAEGLF